jgi:hypothetical protein
MVAEYWIANNSESDPENFSGTDHLKFFANKNGGRWAALSDMDPETRDAALEESVTNLNWPLVDGSYENCAVQCKAGTAVVMTNNTYHRGSRRRDDPSCWSAKPRVMWRMWAYRTQEPEPLVELSDLEEAEGTVRAGWSDAVPEEAAEVWDQMLSYSLGLPAVPAVPAVPPTEQQEEGEGEDDDEITALEWLLFSGGDPITTEVSTKHHHQQC